MPKLSEVVDKPAVTVEPHDALARAAQRMYDENIGSICVVDDGELLGIFTERDLLKACAAGVDTHAATVDRWMTPNPVTATTSDQAAAALQVMLDSNFRHLPVMGEGGLVGVVSIRRLSAVVQAARMG